MTAAVEGSLRPLTEVLGEVAAIQQQPPSRGRGRGRGAFAAANMRKAAASPTQVGRQQQLQSPQSPPPEVVAAAETEEAVRELEVAISNMLPSSSDSSGVEEEKEAVAVTQAA